MGFFIMNLINQNVGNLILNDVYTTADNNEYNVLIIYFIAKI